MVLGLWTMGQLCASSWREPRILTGSVESFLDSLASWLFSPSGSFSRFSSRASLLAMERSSLESRALWELGWPSLKRSP